jgi:predicted ribosome quality control (RQC) complex YloA/Tae2 family protein
MDRDLLDRLTAEAARLCDGAAVRSVLPRVGGGVALLFEGRDLPAIDLAPGPVRPGLAATRRRLPAGEGPGEHALAVLRGTLEGRRLLGADRLAGDRIARLRLDDGGALVVEAIGAGSNIYLLRPDGTVALRLRRAPRPGGDLNEGDRWRPAARPVEPGPPPETGWIPAPATEPSRAGLAAPVAPEAIDPLVPVDPARLVLRTDGPVAGDPVFLEQALLGDALALREEWLGRHERAAARKQRLAEALRVELRRLERLHRKIEAEEREAMDHAVLRRQAEAVLAGLRVARREGGRLRVPDPCDPDGALLEVPIDPAKSDAANAEALFHRAGRLQRALEPIARKRSVVLERRERIAAAIKALEGVERETDLDPIEAVVAAAAAKSVTRRIDPGRERGPRPGGRRHAGKGAPPARVRRVQIDPDWIALIGGSGVENDQLTFRTASPYDFWLHVSDYPGAHVVVRNPKRGTEPPPAVLRRAAELAAHFSKAPRGEATEVRWTQVRYLRKPRGMPAVRVLLSRFASLRVRPQPPARADPYETA